MRHFLLIFLFINILTSFGFGQILIGGKEPKVKAPTVKKEKKPISDTTKFSTRIFFGAGIASTYRNLQPNKNALFADSLGPRADETSRMAWSFQLGFSNDINKYLMWEAGVSYLTNGEKYAFSQADTSHSYTSKYTWIGVPLKLYFKHDFSKFRFQLGAGVIPQLQLKFKQEGQITDRFNKETTIDIKSTNGINNFALAAVGNIGLHYFFTNRVGMYLQMEYRHQLTSSYLKTNAFSHKGTAIGGNIGLTIGL